MVVTDPAQLVRRHRLTVDEYFRIAEVGVLGPEARVELIDGEIIDMAPVSPRHGSVLMRLNRECGLAMRGGAIVAVNDPLRLGPRSEPQPDLMLLAPRADFYAEAHPSAADVLLLIEVSDTTARYDREIKLALYARHGVQEVWIIDLDHRILRTFRGPQGSVYTEVMETASPGRLEPQALQGVVIDASQLLR